MLRYALIFSLGLALAAATIGERPNFRHVSRNAARMAKYFPRDISSLLEFRSTILDPKCYSQFADFYSGRNQVGSSLRLTDYTPNLSVYGMDNTISSACYNGIWIMYEDYDYNPRLQVSLAEFNVACSSIKFLKITAKFPAKVL